MIMTKNILLIGSHGQLGTKLKNELKAYDIKQIDIDNTSDINSYCRQNINHTAIIVTPPSSHLKYITTLNKYEHTSMILCEKPMPTIEEDIIFDDFKKVKIIDHYLYKKDFNSLQKFFNDNQKNIKKISLFLCEKNSENRKWMFDKNQFGGVTYDLAHHLISILGSLIGYVNLNNIRDIDIPLFDQFGYKLADKEMKCTFEVSNLIIELYVGKEINDNKNITFYLDDGKHEKFDLSDTVHYTDILNDQSKLLNIEEAQSVNKVLKNILSEIDKEEEKENNERKKHYDRINKNVDDISLSINNELNSEFQYRHGFYWSSYYKLLVYHLSLIAVPGIFYYNIMVSDSLDKEHSSTISFILSLVILLFMKKLLAKTEKYLDDEDHRLKLPIDKMREIYYVKFGINMYPNGGQHQTYDEILFNQNVKEKKVAKGIGSSYMMNVFKLICWIASSISFGYFLFVILKAYTIL